MQITGPKSPPIIHRAHTPKIASNAHPAQRLRWPCVDVPVTVWSIGLDKAGPLLAGRPAVAVESTRGLEYPVSGGWTDGHNVVVEHHERQTSITFQGMLVVVGNDRLAFPGL